MTYRFNIADKEICVSHCKICVSHCKARSYGGIIKEALYVHVSGDMYNTFDHVIFNEKMPQDATALKKIYNRLPYLEFDRKVLDTADFDDDIEPIM
mgnify:CR=1 FL=1